MIGQRQLSIGEYVAILRRRKWVIIAFTLLGPILGYAVCGVLPKKYVSETTVLVDQPTVPQEYVKSIVNEDLNERLSTMQQQILSRTRLEPIIDRFGLYQKERATMSMDAIVGQLRDLIEVTPLEPMAQTAARELPGFKVKVTFNDPVLAQKICSEVTSMFMEQNLQLRQDLAENTTEFLSKQLDEAKEQLDGQDSKLAAFKRQYMGELPDNEQTNLSLLSELNTQLDANTQALSRAQQDKAFAQSLLAQQIAAWQATQSGDHNPQTLETQLSALQDQLVTLEARYTDDHPDVIKVKSDIAQLKKKIADSNAEIASRPNTQVDKPTAIEPVQVADLRAQIHQYDLAIKQRTAQQQEIQKQIDLYQGRVQLSPAVEQQYKELTRDYQTALDLYNDLLKKRGESAMATELERRQEGEQFRVLDPPSLPSSPSFPKKPFFVLGGFGGGLVLGLGLGVLLELRESVMRTEKDIEFFLRVPTLALLPAIDIKPSPDSRRHGERPVDLTGVSAKA